MAEKKRVSGLGRGLSALLEEAATPRDANDPGVARIAVADIGANPTQPRRHFDTTAMDDLIASVRAHGVLQPILVRPVAAGRYEIIAGERRWRAAQAAGLHEMPAVVRPLDDRTAFEIALIENIQRSDLNAIEEARGYKRLIEDFGHTQQVLSTIVGKSRSHVTNLMRLLDLPEAIQTMVENGALAMGHARALIGAADPVALARRVVAEGLSVRSIEALVAGKPPARPRDATLAPASPAAANDANVDALEIQLADALGMPVALSVAPGATSGSITVRFDSLDQLDWLCVKLIQA
ncbi:ParB/RepB/Spo0J family partition protein [Polymorphobacter fuscus]|uniref:ParB/RepB/Spo0J family partition protein n=1 Tax=Sandarakinorhabdus fusca TaxID=1439888 RepID=A0A7C9GUL6_9SPHN|nr:ParB/RepB/Spo0J family partition protein [Polymorphobacter fuscus]KAB7647723.1 ParB/RepB/Spo0J family partition protein [Polymorphobacter fuscus]MQT17018.1 ParB/RepB/Spo0J family partition protein [Polymorphobacter fuscus]NJC08990.1 ParB family chromosome partitioning protein [Polymorphobacter fuscus]